MGDEDLRLSTFFLGLFMGGGGTVTTLNGKGQELVRIGVSTEGLGLVTAYDPTGRPFRWLRGRSPLSASLPGISDTSDETGLLH